VYDITFIICLPCCGCPCGSHCLSCYNRLCGSHLRVWLTLPAVLQSTGLNKKKAPLIGAFSERNFKHKYNVKSN